MTSRKPQATRQPLAHSWWMRMRVCLRRGFLFILAVLALLLLFVGLEKWRRHQAVVDKLGNDPIMSTTLLGMKFVKQEVKVDDVLFNWKPTSPEIINYFQADGDQRAIFDKLVNFAKESGWADVDTYLGDEDELRFSARKLDFTLHVRVYFHNKENFRIYIKNQ